MKYFKLLDNVNQGTVVRAEGRNQQQYVKGEGWFESGILIDYLCDESPLYDSYEEITEDEAMKLLENM